MITGEQIAQAIRDIAAERPDHVYVKGERTDGITAPCLYVRNGGPDCIVGQALWRLGVIDASLEGTPSNNQTAAGILGDLVRKEVVAPITNHTLDWIMEVQMRQDKLRPWGECISSANYATASRVYE